MSEGGCLKSKKLSMLSGIERFPRSSKQSAQRTQSARTHDVGARSCDLGAPCPKAKCTRMMACGARFCCCCTRQCHATIFALESTYAVLH